MTLSRASYSLQKTWENTELCLVVVWEVDCCNNLFVVSGCRDFYPSNVNLNCDMYAIKKGDDIVR